MNTLKLTNQQYAEKINYTALINCYMREFTNWSRYLGIPKYDESLASYLVTTSDRLHIRFDFTAIGFEVYAPLKFYADSGRHLFNFPVIERNIATDVINPINIYRFMELAIQFSAEEFPDADTVIVNQRLTNSVENIEAFLSYFKQNGKPVNFAKMREGQGFSFGVPVYEVKKFIDK